MCVAVKSGICMEEKRIYRLIYVSASSINRHAERLIIDIETKQADSVATTAFFVFILVGKSIRSHRSWFIS